jgi:hypothetical protein
MAKERPYTPGLVGAFLGWIVDRVAPEVPSKHPNKKDRCKAGDTFGELTLIRRVRSPKDEYGDTWKVKCSCGSILNVKEQYLFRTHHPKTHCGCLLKTNKTLFKREYGIWQMMHRRCYFPTHVSYEYYGALGVKVCDRWRQKGPYDATAFDNFLADNGPAPSTSHSLDRYPNPAGNYEPGNTRWATAEQQGLNKRHNYRR